MIVSVWTTYIATRESLPFVVTSLSRGFDGLVRWLVHMGNSCISKNHRQRNQYAEPYERSSATRHHHHQQDVECPVRTHGGASHQHHHHHHHHRHHREREPEPEREAIPLQRFTNEVEGNTNYRTGTDSSLSEASASAVASVASRTMAQYQELDASSDDFYGEDDDEDDDDASTDTLVMRTLTAIRRLVDK